MSTVIEQDIIPRRTLRGGETIPEVGLGTFGSDKYGADQVAEAVYGGIRSGYRLIDCAAVYQNEAQIGGELERAISEGIVQRKDLFITSKVWNDMHGEGKVAQSCERSLQDLRLSYIDLFFVHWPFPNYHAPGCDGDSRNMYIQGSPEYEHHIKTYGPHREFGYKDFIPMFKAEKFDAAEWADLFQKAGARYVVPVAEHHDGFQMYKSELSHWNACEMGPKRDTLGELCREFAARGLVNGSSSHRVEHWFFMGHGKEFDSDIKDPMERGDFYWPAMPEQDHHDIYSEPMPTQEYLEDWLVRTCEIIDSYRPKLLYFDWWIQHSSVKPYLKKLAAYYYNRAEEWGEEVLINYKHDAFMFGTAVVDIERGQFADVKPYYWQTDTSVALNSWCYTENNRYRNASEIICDMVDIVSKNGNLLLNIGPKADVTIPKEDADILLEIGEWLSANGEAIYGSHVWRKYGEGPTQVVEGQFSDGIKKDFTSQDIRYTCKGTNIYAIVMKCSEDGSYLIPSLGEQDASKRPNFHGIIKNVQLLGFDTGCQWSRDEAGLHLQTGKIQSDKPIVFRVAVD